MTSTSMIEKRISCHGAVEWAMRAWLTMSADPGLPECQIESSFENGALCSGTAVPRGLRFPNWVQVGT